MAAAVSTGFAVVRTAGVGTEGVGAGCAPLGCGGAAADLVFAILADRAGEDDFELVLAEVDVRAGACGAETGAGGAGGCGLAALLATGLGFLASTGGGVDFALTVVTGAAGDGVMAGAGAAEEDEATAAVGTTVTGAVAEAGAEATVTAGAGAGVATGAAADAGVGAEATVSADAGAAVATGAGVETLSALVDAAAAGCVAARGAIRFAMETFDCESFGSTKGGKSGNVLSCT
jgi:hypothetical protein